MADESGFNVSFEGLQEAISKMGLLPDEVDRAQLRARRQATKYALSAGRKAFAQFTNIPISRARLRYKGKAKSLRAWFGASPIPAKAIKRNVIVRTGQVRRVSKLGKKFSVRVPKVYIKGVYHPEMFELKKIPGRPIYMRSHSDDPLGNVSGRPLQIVYTRIYGNVIDAVQSILPGVKSRLESAFIQEATKIITRPGSGKKVGSLKGSTEDRLSGIKFIRTNIR